MDWQASSSDRGSPADDRLISGGKQWITHAGHGGLSTPHQVGWQKRRVSKGSEMVDLDGSVGEGGGQILRTALTLSLLTRRPFQIRKIRAKRDRPGLRPQHLAAVKAAAKMSGAMIVGASVGSRTLYFRPGDLDARDLTLDIGTAGATALVLQTLHLPLAMKANAGTRVVLKGGTFNLRAPSFPFLAGAWAPHLRRIGLPIGLSMPSAGFYPTGGGRIEAWIEPGKPQAMVLDRRGPLVAIRVEAGVCRLDRGIAERMAARVELKLAERGIACDLKVVEWPGTSPGSALCLTADHGTTTASFDIVGEEWKPAETVANEAVLELLAHLDVEDAAVDPYSADQLLLPLAMAEGRSIYTISEVTQHLRTNAATVRAFIDRPIQIFGVEGNQPGRVVIG